MTLSCYIVDDEFHAVRLLAAFVEKTPGLLLAGSATNPLLALQEITESAPQVVFLDVDMPDLNGLQFASLLQGAAIIVFTTSFREYGPEAFEKDATDYLLKPISYERFLLCIQKIRKQLPVAQAPAANQSAAILFKSGNNEKSISVLLSDIRYIKGCDHYLELYLQEQKLIIHLTFGALLQQLPAADFSRIHKSYIVNHAAIRSLAAHHVILTDGSSLPLGRTYREAFRETIKNTSSRV